MSKWQGNPELVRWRRRLVNNTFSQMAWDYDLEKIRSDLVVPEEAITRMEESYRASGGLICAACNLTYNDHPDFSWSAAIDVTPLTELCNGELVHL